ncbi:class 1b ribonucleoside-diphosphate reductase subunit beta [Melghirimyces algeriensis]|uniref:Ribonucleoside-diphosphate reductase subunit beta n=1 Tax=Melghirimyces algeriensis TaxID=910412 RepID=A0A521F7J4_9BACL|nr:class 1b ribonucleoside-diphosphate reductase subunit beta [Melghirimyces algeriensis]SMO92133.1 ribonucleoside-diphosphate reductase class Ib beta subunit [Melghirimyces algeriensis]
MKAVNWNRMYDEYTEVFWKQNISQFWTEDEISVSRDLEAWRTLTEEEKATYVEALSGLTGLDTLQGDSGMPLIALHVDDMKKKAVLSWMGTMEHIHAKSYSHIFTTLLPSHLTDYYLDKWVENQPQLKKKAELIGDYYHALQKKSASPYELYMAMVASVFLESFLFYSGFYYPLYMSGQGKLVASGEIISLIIRDESIHGLYVGTLAQEVYQSMSNEDKEKSDKETTELLSKLYENEIEYTREVYEKVGLYEDVCRFARYNANKALMNLGREPHFPEETVNPIVMNGIRTDTKNHDFFSTKGNGYVLSLNVKPITDDDFVF